MPEGDSLVRLAHRLDPVLTGRTLLRTDFRVPQWATLDLSGRTVDAVRPRATDLLRRADREQDREELRRVRSLAAVVAVAVVETESGRRPVRDLAGWLDPEAFEKMSRRVDLLDRTGTRPPLGAAPRPAGARVCEVAPGRVEASATVVVDGRARALALRIERRLSRWKVTAVEVG